jgi:hypothetical protein
LATARTIALAGDVTATGVSFDGTGNISLTTTIAANSVALGTDTTGNYVATIAGTANEVEVTGSGSENATITIGLPDNVTISGNLTVNGTTTTTDTNELHVIDPLIKLAKDNTANSLDIGFYGQYRASGVNNQFAGLFRDQNDSGKFKLFQLLETEPTTTVDTSGTGYAVATLVATLEGNVTGNLVGNVTGNTSGTAATVTTAAQPAITSVGTLTALQVDNININGNTISSTAGTDLNITPLAGQQIVLDGVINIDAGVITGATSITSTNFVGNLTGNADTATTLATARTIGGTSFDGSANIAIALANTATTLATARTIGGTSFDGSADIAIALANTATTLVNNRDFSITGDITASAVAFNGSGNVELSATIDNNVVDAAALNVTGNGTAGQALLSVGDGSFSWGDPSKTTEQIQDIVGGMVTGNTETGIAVTYEDGDGTLDFVINPAQTTITSLLATDIKIGEDDETKIDFETADEIHFYAANAHQLKIIDGALVPVTNNDIDLGTSSLEFKDAFFDGTVTSDAFAGPLTGAVTGNASTATALETARTIGGTSFDGTANIAIALSATTTALATARTIGGTSFDGTANIDVALSTLATNVTLSANDTTDETVYPTFADGATGTQGLETDTGLTYNPSTGMLTATAFTGALTGNSSTATALETARTIGGTSFDGSANIAVALSATATALATARTIGGVSFDGTANIDLAGVNTTGNQDTSGNAATATILATGRTINGVSFNGSANITTLTAGTGVAVSGTAVSIGQAVATSDSPTFANLTLGGTDSVKVPVGTTGQRNGSPVNGMFRYNSTNDEFEGYQDGAWGAIAGGGGASAMETDNFTGDGTTTDFTLTSSIESEDNLMVFIEGVFQNKATYAASGTTIAFATAPANTRKIVVFHVRASISGASMVQNAFTGNGSTTAYTLSALPNNENNTFVYIDGVYQNKATYSVSGTTLTFSTAPANTTAIEVMMFAQTSINVPASNSVTTSTIADGNVTTAKINNSAITLAKMAANSVDSDQYVDGSIDLIHMSANSVDSDQYVDGSIDTVHIADGAVTSAKLDTNIAIDAIEGQDLQNLAKGTSDAKQVTLSFWVKSNVTGTYAGLLWDAPNSRLNSKSYTVNSSGVWEYKTIVFSGDQTGAIDDDNTEGLAVKLILGAGTTWTGGAEGISPISGNQNRYAASQAVNVAASVSNYWQITGVQLEVGSVATEFEHRSYGEELALCQRYYQHSNGTGAHPTNGADATSFGTGALPLGTCTIWGGSVAGHCPIYLPVTMRATPSVTKYGNSSGYIAYLSTGTSAPASDNTLTFHQDFYIGAQNANVISLNNQASGSPVWGAYGAWSAYAEL